MVFRRRFLQSLAGVGSIPVASTLYDQHDGGDGGGTGDAARGGQVTHGSADLNASDTGDDAPKQPPSRKPDSRVHLMPAPETATPTEQGSVERWLYTSSLPGPTIRVREGDVVAVTVRNHLPQGTTVHWHGLPVANAMDGVPRVTQAPIGKGKTFTYKFRAEPAGTYLYHSHTSLQQDWGLSGALVVTKNPVSRADANDRVFVLDDYRDSKPSMGVADPSPPEYAGYLANGTLPSDYHTYDVPENEHVRLRFLNAGSATTFRVRVAGHTMAVTHADGRPVSPVEVDALDIAPGERYDADLHTTNPGSWFVEAAPLGDPDATPARAAIRYHGEQQDAEPDSPSGSPSSVLAYGDLHATDRIGVAGRPDRTFDLDITESGRRWQVNGQSYPHADPLAVTPGEHVRLSVTNETGVDHPMHLHGHFFRVGNAVKDTVRVPAGTTRTLDFAADNPGDWLFACQNPYHFQSGLGRVVRYA
ncbi:multicopper oxidase family protein [Halarchaeum sp. P4]|uniref:multicopper oxidase family protein n=1 Tax=Halarchaeum sp. P4 TaxID=3421639 RepID=UPI003EB7B01E